MYVPGNLLQSSLMQMMALGEAVSTAQCRQDLPSLSRAWTLTLEKGQGEEWPVTIFTI